MLLLCLRRSIDGARDLHLDCRCMRHKDVEPQGGVGGESRLSVLQWGWAESPRGCGKANRLILG